MREKLAPLKTPHKISLDKLTIELLDELSGQESKSRPEIISSAVKLLFLKKRGIKELNILTAE